MKAGLLKYGIGLGLLALVIWLNWNARPGKSTPEGQNLATVGGGLVNGWEVATRTTPGLGETLSRPIHILPMLVGFVLCAGALLLTIVRWHLLVRAQNLDFPLRSAMRLGLVGYFLNTFMPGSVGGDILKAVAISREQSRRAVAVSTIIIDRAIGLWAIVWFVALAGGVFWLLDDPVLTNSPQLQRLVILSSQVILVTVLIWVGLGFLSERRSERISLWFRTIPRLGGSLSEMWDAARLYRRQRRAVFLALALSLVSHCGWISAFHFAARTFEVPDAATDLPTYSQHMLIVPVGMTLQALFPAPGGVGGGEAAFAWLYSVVGRPAANGILACLAQRVISWSLGLIGYLFYLRMKGVDRVPTPAERALAEG